MLRGDTGLGAHQSLRRYTLAQRERELGDAQEMVANVTKTDTDTESPQHRRAPGAHPTAPQSRSLREV